MSCVSPILLHVCRLSFLNIIITGLDDARFCVGTKSSWGGLRICESAIKTYADS